MALALRVALTLRVAAALALALVLPAAAAAPAAPAASSSLRLDVFANSALAAPPRRSLPAPGLALSLPLDGSWLSAEITGTFTPPVAPGARFDFDCGGPPLGLARLFVWVDDHLICQFGAFNSSVNGVTDELGFAVRGKAVLPVRAHAYAAPGGGSGNASFEVHWCPSPGACAPLPAATLDAALPAPELARRALQQRAASGWGTWLHRDVLSVVLLPDSAVVTTMLCHLPTGACLEGTQIDGNSGGPQPPVRVGTKAMNGGYSQLYVTFLTLNVSVEFAATADGALDLAVTPQADSLDLEQYAVVYAGRFAWGRLGAFAALGPSGGLQFAGAGGLRNVSLFGTAPPLAPGGLPEIHEPGFPYLFPCSGDKECASEVCAGCNGNGCWGLCDKETPLVFYAAAFPGPGAAVGLSTTAGSSVADIQARLAAARAAEVASYQRFGAALAEVTEAVTAAVAWSSIYVPTEYGPTITTSFRFEWISPAPVSYDFAYVTFDWDNILQSYIAGVLGFRDAAYSSFIQVIKSKTNDGFIPNWSSGGSHNQQSEPMMGAKVLLDLFTRFGDAWLVELLFDDLMDWHSWQWASRRVVVPGSACCDEPGYISVGNDYSGCATPADCVNSYKGESGLDQSPKWDCVGAAPDGSGGDCSGMAVNGSNVLQMGETQSSSLFVADAEALAALAAIVNRTAERAVLLARAASMRAQVARLFDDGPQQSFMDLYVNSGRFSTHLSPTSLYPLMAGAATAPQVRAMVGHLTNASELCVSANYESNPETCYWGLPSISASDPSYMQPLDYVYWRGYSWGPMSILTYWSLDAARAVDPAAAAGAAALAAHKGGRYPRNKTAAYHLPPTAHS